MSRRLAAAAALTALVAACAAPSKGGEARAPSAADAESAPPSPAAQAYAPPAPAPEQPGGTRAFALREASGDLEAAQRELDLASSDCRNACRALGSMDRAAGRVCALTRDGEAPERCDDAKQKLYSARERVRSSCGSCPDGQPAVERDAPIPSVR